MSRFLDYLLPMIFLMLMAYSAGQQARIADTLDRIETNTMALRYGVEALKR
jgi:hypothetical protein